MASVTFAGSILPTVGQPHTIGTITSAGVYIVCIDTGQLTGTDEFFGTIILQGALSGTVSPAYPAAWRGRQSTPIKISPPVAVTHNMQIILKQNAGSARWFPFEVISIG